MWPCCSRGSPSLPNMPEEEERCHSHLNIRVRLDSSYESRSMNCALYVGGEGGGSVPCMLGERVGDLCPVCWGRGWGICALYVGGEGGGSVPCMLGERVGDLGCCIQ